MAADFAVVLVSNTITRPADTTAYASGDLVANSTTAASVTPFSFGGAIRAGLNNGFRIEEVRLRKSTTSTTNASFRAHFYRASPGTPTNGDNGAWLTSGANYVGGFDITCDRVFSDGAFGRGVPLVGSSLLMMPTSGSTLFALLEARGAYTPGNAETFTLDIEGYRF